MPDHCHRIQRCVTLNPHFHTYTHSVSVFLLQSGFPLPYNAVKLSHDIETLTHVDIARASCDIHIMMAIILSQNETCSSKISLSFKIHSV